MSVLYPVILSGGSGTRLWPLSRQLHPKQLLSPLGGQTLFEATVSRMEGLDQATGRELMHPIVVCNEEHRFLIAQQLHTLGREKAEILLEPFGRNTAPALTLAALTLEERGDGAALMLVTPADHVVARTEPFRSAVGRACAFAEEGHLVTLGCAAQRPETGYGYIRKGEPVDDRTFRVSAFVEKPDAAQAERYLEAGDYLWNSGIFVLRADIWLEQIGSHRPDIAHACRQAYANGRRDRDFYRVDPGHFRQCPSDSIDYSVMERITDSVTPYAGNAPREAVVVPFDASWSDVGAWSAVWQLGEKDGNGNVTKGDVFADASRDCLLLANHRLVAALGLEDILVVETADAVLVADRRQSQEVKKVVAWLDAQNREERLNHRRVCRPWGSFECVDADQRHKVKRITVDPGAALSLQMHHHRAEHWIVVKGTAKVTRGDETLLVSENESTFIPIGTPHRLENPGVIPLELIEVQSGSYLGEDDIVRFDDRYGR